MANEILIQDVAGSSLEQIIFYVSGSFSPTDSGTNWTIGGTPIEGVLTLAGVADGAARQSDKIDLGALRAESYDVFGCVDYTGETPGVGTIDYYWSPSGIVTQGSGNVAGNSGADADAPGGALGSITLAEFLLLLNATYIGSLTTHDGAVVQNGYVGRFSPPARFGQLIVVNNGGDAFEADDVEMHQVMNPVVREIQ